MLLRLNQLHINHMSCPVETDLNRHLEQLDIQAKEEKYAEENPSYYWFITTNKWDEHAY